MFKDAVHVATHMTETSKGIGDGDLQGRTLRGITPVFEV